ncbi:hypothetical protein [Roseateles sp. P5_D6]
MPHRSLWSWLLFAWLAFAPLANACPPEFEDRVSAYERVKAAPTIVWAKALSAIPGRSGSDEVESVVSFEVREVLRGRFVLTSFRAAGTFVDADAMDHPMVGRYHRGSSYLFFLTSPAEEGLVSLPYSFNAPASAEAATETSALLTGARHYARVAALNDAAKERTALLALQAHAKATPERYPAALADDIAAHFQAPSPYKTYAELLALYRQPSADDTQKAYALWAMASAPKPEARNLFEQLVRSGGWREHASATAEFITLTRDGALMSRLLAELPSIHNDYLRSRVLGAAIAVAGKGDQPAMLRALREARPQDQRWMAPWFVQHPTPAATALLKRNLRPPYEEQYEFAFDLASLGDRDVLAWAQRRASTRHEGAWMGRYAIARSPLPQADTLAHQIIRGGNADDLAELIQGYEHAHHAQVWARLGDVVALPQRAPEVERWVKTVLKRRAEAGEPQAVELLRVLDTPPPLTAQLKI